MSLIINNTTASFVSQYATYLNPGDARAIYEECGGFGYCMPIETCRHVLNSSQYLYRVMDVGVIICVFLLIIFCEYYYRKYRQAKKELEERKCITETSTRKE